MRAYCFTDTNVLLHYQFSTRSTGRTSCGPMTVVQVFAPVVFSELDRHKTIGSRREETRGPF